MYKSTTGRCTTLSLDTSSRSGPEGGEERRKGAANQARRRGSRGPSARSGLVEHPPRTAPHRIRSDLPSWSTMSGITTSRLTEKLLPILPAIATSNVLAISMEWICHLQPLSTLHAPIASQAMSEIFRRSYINGATTFLFNLGLAIGSSWYNWYLLGNAMTGSPTDGDLSRTLYGWAAVFGVLHLAPFGLLIVRHVHKACDGKGRIKDEKEVKKALRSWLGVNQWRIWMDVAAVLCAVGAVVVD